MKVKATVLCENCVFSIQNAIAEHGWSLFLETEEGNFLLDTGQGKGIINNAQLFGVDLKTLKGIILSHHHWDHTGGLLSVLNVTGEIDIFTHPLLFKESFRVNGNKERFLGMPFTRKVLECKGAKFNFNKEFTEIAPGIFLTGEVPRKNDYEKGDTSLLVKTEQGYVRDELLDDQSVVIETEKGLFIALGCSHAGIINTLEYIVEKTGQSHIYAVVGGTHLGPVSREQKDKSIKALQEFDIEKIGVSHCTGLKTSAELSQVFGDRFFFCNVGTVITN